MLITLPYMYLTLSHKKIDFLKFKRYGTLNTNTAYFLVHSEDVENIIENKI